MWAELLFRCGGSGCGFGFAHGDGPSDGSFGSIDGHRLSGSGRGVGDGDGREVGGFRYVGGCSGSLGRGDGWLDHDGPGHPHGDGDGDGHGDGDGDGDSDGFGDGDLDGGVWLTVLQLALQSDLRELPPGLWLEADPEARAVTLDLARELGLRTLAEVLGVG